MVEEAGVKSVLTSVRGENLMDFNEEQNQKLILGMIWMIILHYAINGISVDDLTAKEGLLMWVRKKTKNYREVDPPGVNNFTRDWKTGLAFCALIHRHRPELIDYDSLDRANDTENLELAFSVAEGLGIPRLLDVEDLQEEKPDERSVMTYVSEYFHCFASSELKEGAARRCKNFIKFARAMEEMCHDYERRARAFIAWCNSTSERFSTASDFGESLQDALGGLASFRDFIVSERPPQMGEKIDIGNLFAEIQTELLINERAAYVPPEDCSPDAMDVAEKLLHEAESVYSANLRTNRFRFVEKRDVSVSEEKMTEFQESFKAFDKDNSGHLSAVEFKAACSAIGIPFKDDDHFIAEFKKASNGDDNIELQEYINYLVGIEEEKDTPESVKSSFKMMADEATMISDGQLNCPPLEADDIEYLRSKLPSAGEGMYDYNAYVNKEFGVTE